MIDDNDDDINDDNDEDFDFNDIFDKQQHFNSARGFFSIMKTPVTEIYVTRQAKRDLQGDDVIK